MENIVKNKVSEILRDSFQVSVISKMEFLGFPFDLAEREKAIGFMQYATVRKLRDDIVQCVINIRQEKRIKLPDAIIAATARLCCTNKMCSNLPPTPKQF